MVVSNFTPSFLAGTNVQPAQLLLAANLKILDFCFDRKALYTEFTPSVRDPLETTGFKTMAFFCILYLKH